MSLVYEMDSSYEDSQDEGYGSDSRLTFARDAINYIAWHEPDDDFANANCITKVKSELDQAFDIVHMDEQFLPEMNAASASCA